jgi:hypothetical protein
VAVVALVGLSITARKAVEREAKGKRKEPFSKGEKEKERGREEKRECPSR